MYLNIFHPRPPLDEFIQNFVYYENYSAGYSIERMLPDGSVYIIIDLTETPKHVYENGRIIPFRQGWISGIKFEYITLDAARESSMMVARFKPGQAAQFFDFPLTEISGHIIELDQIWGSLFRDFREQILSMKEPHEKVARFQDFLISRAVDRLTVSAFANQAIRMMERPQEYGSIRSISERFGYSHKHFISLFERQFGLKPKFFTRLIKFNQILELLDRKQRISWQEVAFHCGYFDQAHFIHEFKHFSGLNPSVYMDLKTEYPHYVPVG